MQSRSMILAAGIFSDLERDSTHIYWTNFEGQKQDTELWTY